MMAHYDYYGSEVMALIVLTALSALGHFWYIMILICAVTVLGGALFLCSRLVLRAKNEMLARLLSPARRKNTAAETEVPLHTS
jgi:hypothetical protein